MLSSILLTLLDIYRVLRFKEYFHLTSTYNVVKCVDNVLTCVLPQPRMLPNVLSSEELVAEAKKELGEDETRVEVMLMEKERYISR